MMKFYFKITIIIFKIILKNNKSQSKQMTLYFQKIKIYSNKTINNLIITNKINKIKIIFNKLIITNMINKLIIKINLMIIN